MKDILKRLVAGESLSSAETEQILIGITKEAYPPEQVTAFIMGIQMRGVTVEEILGLRNGILATGVPVNLDEFKPLDIVGTGGDSKNTFNISTCSCFVVAGAGYKVAKHGNYAATSVSGASNVIEGHGVKFTADEDRLRRSIEQCGVAYLHAPLFARALKFVSGIRRALQIPTCFNLLGPLVNPCRPAYQVLGVANLDQMRLYNNVNQRLGIGYCIVNSLDGYDEISLTGPFKAQSRIMEKIFTPEELGFHNVNPDEICGGEGQTKDDALRVFDAVLSGTATRSQTDVVVANSAFAIHAVDPAKSIEECIAAARESIGSGKAMATLKKFVELNS
ncbi:MAG: anthranilate phosphoribosyltransferase [Bacteroidales bacterium]|nr:anthranilate phosphoribosyltransferase [Bacteroidales bacterium]